MRLLRSAPKVCRTNFLRFEGRRRFLLSRRCLLTAEIPPLVSSGSQAISVRSRRPIPSETRRQEPALTPLPTTATAAYASKDSIGRMKKVGDARLRLAAGEQKQ